MQIFFLLVGKKPLVVWGFAFGFSFIILVFWPFPVWFCKNSLNESFLK